MASTANFDKDLAFRQQQLAQQAAEAAALSTYRLYRTQLIERGMMALEADKAAREMALNVANSAFQQQMGRAQAVLNAPRGPADWAAYANRLRGLQQSGELPGALGTLALPGRTATYSNGGQAPPVPLTNTQFADAATFGLTGGTPAAPTLYGPAWATQRLAAQPYQAPTGIPAYYANPTDYSKLPAGTPPAVPTNLPPGYALAPQTQAAAGALSAQVMPGSYGQQTLSGADLFGPSQAPTADWYQQQLDQMIGDPNQAMPGEPPIAADEDMPVPGSGLTKRQMRMAARQAQRAQRNGQAPPAQPQAPQQQAPSRSSGYQDAYTGADAGYGDASPYGGASAQGAGDLFGMAVQPQGVAAQAYGGPTAADPNQRGLYGSDVSYQRFRNLSPTEKDLVTGYAEEGMGGYETQSKEDFLNGMIQAAPNYTPARTATWAGIR